MNGDRPAEHDTTAGDAPAVSIIMNVRNGAAFLREAMDGLMAQTFQDWELIVWDDNSTDESVAIIEEYCDPRIRRFRSDKDLPLTQVRELALREVRAQWIAFLDQDDIWLPAKLERQMALTERDPDAGIIYGRTVCFSERGFRHDFARHHEFAPLPEGNILNSLIVHSCFIAMSSAMLRTSCVEELGAIPPEVEICPDYYLFLGIAERYRAIAVEEVVCLYRIHPAHMSRVMGAQLNREILWLIDRWSSAVEPRVIDRRRRVYETLLALHEMSSAGSRSQGLARLVQRGSLPYLFTRPFVRCARIIRRVVRRSRWKHNPATAAPAGVGMTRRPVLTTRVSASTFDEAVDALGRCVAHGRAAYVSAANAYSVSLATRDLQYQARINGATLVTPDGMPVVWTLRQLGEHAERVHNDDLFFACCERFPEWRHCFVGGREGQPEAVAEALRQRYPNIIIVGTQSTPQRPVPAQRTEAILETIHRERPSIVWVGMGTPAQDEWMSVAAARAGVPMVGVGSLFDLVTGRTRPTPMWMKRAGLQWLFRLAQEPRRLAFRYLWYNSIFTVGALRQIIAHRFGAAAARLSRSTNEHQHHVQ